VVVSSEETSDTAPTVVTDASSLGTGMTVEVARVTVEVEGTGVLTEVETVVGFIVVVVVVVVLVVLVEVDVVLFMDVSNSFKVTRHFSNCSNVTSFVIASICKCVSSIFSAVVSSSMVFLQCSNPLILWFSPKGPSQ
jgi:hypothetical protein